MSRTECHVCMEDFSAHERIPKALRCGHTFCNLCLENMTSKGQLKCPTCKRRHTLPAGGVQDISTNFCVLDMLDSVCKYCKKLSDTNTCFHCPAQLCSGCLTDHVGSEVSDVTTEMVDTASDLLHSLDTKLKTIGECLAQYRTLIDTSRDFLKQSVSDLAVKHIYKQIQICTDSMSQLESGMQVQLRRVDMKIPRKVTHSRETSVSRGKHSCPPRGATGSNTQAATEQTPGGARHKQSATTTAARGTPPRPPALSRPRTRMPDLYKTKPSRVFGSTGSALNKFDGPCGAARNMSGDVLIADAGNRRVCVYDAQYRPKSTISVRGHATSDVCVTPSGGVAAVCHTALSLFSAAGQLVWKVGHEGEESEFFDGARGVTCDSAGLLYICDWNNSRLQVYNQSGEYVRSITGDGDARMDEPVSVAVHPKTGRLYVADRGYKRVSIYTADGRYEGCMADIWGVDRVNPQYVSFRDDGLLALSDHDNECVHLLRDGQLVQTIGLGELKDPCGTVFTAGGDLVICNFDADNVHVFTIQT